MPKEDKDLLPGFDVQVIPVSANGTSVAQQGTVPNAVPMPSPNGSGYVMTAVPNAPIFVVPQPAPQAPSQPSLVVITLAPKKDDKKEAKTSSVFQRL